MKLSRIMSFLRFFGLHHFWYWYASIGINFKINPEDADGVFYAMDGNGSAVVIPFIAHNPNALINPDQDILESLFDQCRVFGYEAITVQLRTGPTTNRVYYAP